MVELTVCQSCSSPVSTDHAFCPRCGAALPAAEPEPMAEPEPVADAEPVADPAAEPAVEADAEPEDPRLAPLRMAPPSEAPVAKAALDAPSSTPPIHVPSVWPADLEALQRQTEREVEAKAVAEEIATAKAAAQAQASADADVDESRAAGQSTAPIAEENPRVPGGYLAPSASHRTLDSIGAGRPAEAFPRSAGSGSAVSDQAVPASAARQPGAPEPAGGGVLGRVPSPGDRPTAPVLAAAATARPSVPMTRSAWIAAQLASVAAEPKTELAATGLTALGGAFALVSFFLPWTSLSGMGIGTMSTLSSPARPSAWAFDTAAGWPIVLLTVLALASVLASDRLEELMPALAATIRRLNEVVVPMILGGIYLGVGLLYFTLPWGCGSGIVLLTLGALLLIAGSIVGLFFPAGERKT